MTEQLLAEQLAPLTDDQLDELIQAWHEARLYGFNSRLSAVPGGAHLEIVDGYLPEHAIGFLSDVANRHGLHLGALAGAAGGVNILLSPSRTLAETPADDGAPDNPTQDEPETTDEDGFRVLVYGDSVLVNFGDHDRVLTLDIAGSHELDTARETIGEAARRVVALLADGGDIDEIVKREQPILNKVWGRVRPTLADSAEATE